MRMLYGLLLIIGGLYTPYFYAGNGNIVAKKEEQEEKKVIQPIYKKQECAKCKNEAKENTNPLWMPCGKSNRLHKICKLQPIYPLWEFGCRQELCQRNKSGFIPLSIAIFRSKKNETWEREDSYSMVRYITNKFDKSVVDLLMLRDHCKCSTWMHAIYSDNVEVVKIIVSAVVKHVEDPEEAVWKLLTNQDSGGKWLLHARKARHNRKLTPLMVAVKRKNIELIKLLKALAGKRFQEYLLMKGGWGETANSFADNHDEILELLLL